MQEESAIFKITFGALLACLTVASWIYVVGEESRFRKFFFHLFRIGEQVENVQFAFYILPIETMCKMLSNVAQICLAMTTHRRSGLARKSRGWMASQSDKSKQRHDAMLWPFLGRFIDRCNATIMGMYLHSNLKSIYTKKT